MEHFADVERVEEFQFIPKMMVLGSYGGGDAMQIARQLCCVKCPESTLQCRYIADLKRDMLGHIESIISQERNIPIHKRVAKLPLSAQVCLEGFKQTVHFQVSSLVYGEAEINAMYQVYFEIMFFDHILYQDYW